MRIFISLVALVAVLVVVSGASLARGLGKVVTKATQKELELNYELSAIRDPNAVIVSMTISKEGKLADLRHVRLSILAENQKDFLILAPLEMLEVDGKIRVSAQLDPGMAEKARLDLVVEEGRREYFYAVSLKDYITERGN